MHRKCITMASGSELGSSECLNSTGKLSCGGKSVESVISLLKFLETSVQGAKNVSNPIKNQGVTDPPHPLLHPVQVISDGDISILKPRYLQNKDGREITGTYSLYSTDSESTLTGAKRNMDKVSKLISLLLGKEVCLENDFDESIVANEVIDHLSKKTFSKNKVAGDKENSRPAAGHERKSSTAKIFPKVIKRKTLSVKNVRPKTMIAASMKQHQIKLKEQNRDKSVTDSQTPKKFVRACCKQNLPKCVHTQTKEIKEYIPKVGVAAWNVDTPHTSSLSSGMAAQAVMASDTALWDECSVRKEEPKTSPKEVTNVRTTDLQEIPVRDSDPDPLPPRPLSPLRVIEDELEDSVFQDDCKDDLRTFYSQRRALKFLLKELKDLLKTKYGPLEKHTERVLEGITKIVALMQNAKYVPALQVDDISTASFSSIDLDLAMQPMRQENVELRSRLRETIQMMQKMTKGNELAMSIFDEIEGVSKTANVHAKAMEIKEQIRAKRAEISSLKEELQKIQQEMAKLTNEKQDLLRLLGSKEGDSDRLKLDAVREASRLRRDLQRYEGDLERSAGLQREKEEKIRVVSVTLREKEDEIQRLNDLVQSLQRSMAAFVSDLQEAGPHPETPPLPPSLLVPADHLVGPGGDGPSLQNLLNIPQHVPKQLSPSPKRSSPKPNVMTKNSNIHQLLTMNSNNHHPSTIPKAVSDSLRDFLEKSSRDASEDEVGSFDKTVTPPQSPPPSDAQVMTAESSRFSVTAYLKKYGLQTDATHDAEKSSSSLPTPSYATECSNRQSSTFAQSTPLVTPVSTPIKKPFPSQIRRTTDMKMTIDDDSTLTGISDISTISAFSGDGSVDSASASVSSIASQDEMEFKAGLEELDASIQRLKLSLKKAGTSKNL